MKIKMNRFEEWWHYSTLRDLYYYLRNRLFKRYDLIRTGLPKHHWIDKDYVMLYGMMELLVDFVENEKCFEIVDWENDEVNPHHKIVAQEIREIYDWWKSYKEKCESIGDSIDDELLYEEEQDMLIRLVKIRKYLWV